MRLVMSRILASLKRLSLSLFYPVCLMGIGTFLIVLFFKFSFTFWFVGPCLVACFLWALRLLLRPVDIFVLRNTFEAAPHGIIVWDENYMTASINPAARSFLCLEPGRSVSFGAFDPLLQTPESIRIFERLRAYTEHGQEGREWLEIHLKEGIFGVMIHVKPQEGRRVFWFLDVDLTPLNESLESPLFKDLLEAAPSPILVTSPQGRIRYANKSFLEWLGYDAKNVLKQSVDHFVGHKTELSPGQKPQLLAFKNAAGYKQQGTLSDVYAFHTKTQDLGLFIVPEMLPPEEMLHLGALLENIPLPAVFLDHRGMVRLTNRRFEKVIRERKILGRRLKDWLPGSEAPKLDRFLQQVRRERDQNHFLTVELASKDPTSTMRMYATYITSLGWDPMGCFMAVFYDVTEIQKRENQTLESQKLQALGQLAGGISHDFNNLLTAMLGFCDLLLQRHSPQDNSFTDIMHIKQNANRAANLVRQLLLFSKQSAPDPKPLDLRECLNEMSFLLRRLIGPKVELEIKHDRSVRMIYADQGQFEQVVMNLAINARDAMPNGGTLVFRIRSVQLKEPLPLLRHTLPPKTYNVVEVSDSGSGISQENIDKIFTPFFSTKAPGRGTGLGLATVYQILEGLGGGIHVESTVDQGTVFSIYMPRYVERKKRAEDIVPAEPVESRGHLLDFWESARILIVEDEDPVRLFASRALKSKGYEVFEAKDGLRGFEILQKTPNIHLLITDVMMPGMDGPTLVNAAYGLNPSLKVLFVSGYPEEDVHVKLSFPEEQVYFLPKPFNLNELAVKVHDVLGGPVRD